MLTDKQKDAIKQRIVSDLKQACLDVSSAAVELFDRFDEHGLEAAWEGDGALVVLRLGRAYEQLREFLAQQAARRLVALGVPLSSLIGAEGQES